MIRPSDWTIGIVTNGMDCSQLHASVGDVLDRYGPSLGPELIVVGGRYDKFNQFDYPFTHIDYPEYRWHVPSLTSIKSAIKEKSFSRLFVKTGDICGKKNLIARVACRDYLLLIHDYFRIDVTFFEKITAEMSFDIAIPRITNADGTRFRDFTCWDHPSFQNGEKGALLPYEYDDYSSIYISGGVMVVNKKFLLDNSLNSNLFWGEGEDVEWSIRVRHKANIKKVLGAEIHSLKHKPNPLADEGWRRRTSLLSFKNNKDVL